MIQNVIHWCLTKEHSTFDFAKGITYNMIYAVCGLALFCGLLAVKVAQLSKKVHQEHNDNVKAQEVKPFLKTLTQEQFNKLQAAVIFEGDFYSEFLESLTEKQKFNYRIICVNLGIKNFTKEELKLRTK